MNARVLTFFLCCTALSISAQSYDTAFGMRLGTDWGLTVKQRILDKTTLEVILQTSLQREEALVTLLGTQHLPFITKRLNLYVGGGLHKGWGNVPTNAEGNAYKDPFGLTIIGGLELSLGKLNLTYDIKPAINLIGGERTVYAQTGISVRYVILKRNWLEKKRRKKRRQKEGINWRFWEN
ncbi:MAG: hypothetical protein RIC19_15965 [Phaeodactylibacter sp.]|uniref:hypothetical protein n=1 Tax=Phaeodactylibacter sp. TaxID=1940289 RepID=UPI0032EDF799